MGIPQSGMSLDRIDNEKGYYPENCRWADRTTQGFNTKVRTGSRSGIKGVHKIKNGKWVAVIFVRGKSYHLGCFVRIEDAIQARIKTEHNFIGWSPTEKYVTLRAQKECSLSAEQLKEPKVS